MPNNTTPETYGEDQRDEGLTREEILMTEDDILAGMLEAGNGRDDVENYRKISIQRNGKALFEFRVRPLSEKENQICWRRATKYTPAKPGKPKIAIETDEVEYRSQLIYAATVNEDRAKTWDNKKAQEALGVLQGVDLIDKVLLAGEKSRILDVIDEISGSAEDADELAKN